MVELFANSVDPDQMPRSAASDLGLHCVPVTNLGVFNRLISDMHDKDTLLMTCSIYMYFSEL